MAKSQQRFAARTLRKTGLSMREIAHKLHVAKSSVSLWVQDIILTPEQLVKLKLQNIQGGANGRLLGSLKHKQKRQKRIKKGISYGQKIFSGGLTKKELLVAGIALYWAEGTKKKRELAFCNSDPKLVQFMITWLKTCFKIPKNRLVCYVGINEIHREREKLVKEYWSQVTGISLSVFRKTSFKKVRNKKLYDNFETHYGTLTVKVTKPSQLYYDLMGLIEGLANNGGRVAQW